MRLFGCPLCDFKGEEKIVNKHIQDEHDLNWVELGMFNCFRNEGMPDKQILNYVKRMKLQEEHSYTPKEFKKGVYVVFQQGGDILPIPSNRHGFLRLKGCRCTDTELYTDHDVFKGSRTFRVCKDCFSTRLAIHHSH